MVESDKRLENIGDVEKIERGGSGDEADGTGMEEDQVLAKDPRVKDRNLEVGRTREKVGNLYEAVVIKDEIEVEDSIILSDPEFDQPDEEDHTDPHEDDGNDADADNGSGKECEENDESEKPLKRQQCKAFQSHDEASALQNKKQKESERSQINAALEKRNQKEARSSLKNTAVKNRESKESESTLKNVAVEKTKQKEPKKTVLEKLKEKESESSLKNVLEKQWSNSGKEKSDALMDENVNESSNSGRHNLEDNDLQSLIKYLVTKKRPDKETIKKIVLLTRTKLSKLEDMEVADTELADEENKEKRSKAQAEPIRVISKAQPNRVISKVEPRRVISKKSASELKEEIIQTMKRNAEERENEVRRAAKVMRRTNFDENEEEKDNLEKGRKDRRMEEDEKRIRDEQHKKMRTENLLKKAQVA